MADAPPILASYISDLPPAGALVGTELVEIQAGDSAGASQKVSTQDVANLAPVTSVNGQVKEVNLTTTDIPEGDKKYYTDVRNARSTVTALTIVAGVVTIDLALGAYFTLALTDNVTGLVFANLPDVGLGQTISIRIQQDATGGRTLVMPASFHQIAGTATAINAAANGYTVLMLTSFDQGTRWEYTMQQTVD